MIIKQLIDEDFSNYKKASMFIGFPHCTFKCEKEIGKQVCQNGILANSPDILIDASRVVKRYDENKLTSAVVCGGLEPMDDFDDLLSFISEFRKYTNDDIVVYTGYYKDEILYKVAQLSQYKNIIIKYGRYHPGQEKHWDDVLGVYLASNNQYAEKIS